MPTEIGIRQGLCRSHTGYVNLQHTRKHQLRNIHRQHVATDMLP